MTLGHYVQIPDNFNKDKEITGNSLKTSVLRFPPARQSSATMNDLRGQPSHSDAPHV